MNNTTGSDNERRLQQLPTEQTPLLHNNESSFFLDGPRGQATDTETILNTMKTCMGTGCLALAYASQQGGVVLYIAGSLCIGSWNVWCVHLLLDSLTYLPQNENPATGVSKLGHVAQVAFGDMGLIVLDCMMIVLLMGIIVAYVSATISFVGDTPLSLVSWLDAALASSVMGILSLVPDMGHLSSASAVGLIVLGVVFVVIAGYGFAQDHSSAVASVPLNLWPTSINGLSHWFGIVVFGFGTVPLTYNLQESMQSPKHMVFASSVALGGVALLYSVLGVGLYILFPSLTSDVLHELPENGWLPVFTRLAMTGTVLSTAPLLVVPCAELIEGRLGMEDDAWHRCGVRFSIVWMSAMIAYFLPGFVHVLSFVGCLCVSTVSFIMPPLLHWRLIYLAKKATLRSSVADGLLLLWGIISTVVSTICTLKTD